MDASLREPIEKVEWAKAHLNSFREASKVFFEAHPDLVNRECKSDGSKTYSFRGVSLPIRLSLRIGDVISNLRSSLDYLVWQLVLANGETPSGRNEFPIYENELSVIGKRGCYRKDGLRKLRGVSPTNQTIIERLQPYNGGKANLFLASLNTLRNEDIHRSLTLTVVKSTGSAFVGTYKGESISDVLGRELASKCYYGPLEYKTVLCTLSGEYMDVNFVPVFSISLRYRDMRDGKPVDSWLPATSFLYDHIATVEKVIQLFSLPSLYPTNSYTET